MEIDSIIQQLSMPVSFLNGEERTLGLESTQNSSDFTYSSNNSSWMSESSCGCHSPRAPFASRSSLIFNNRCILPPLLCSSSRTEMQVYRRKAVEKEQTRRKKHSRNVVAKVENILANAENCQRTLFTPTHSTDNLEVSTEEIVDLNQMTSNLVINNSLPQANQEQDSTCNSSSQPPVVNDMLSSEACCDSDDESAYRLSLRKLLEKSMTVEESFSKSIASGCIQSVDVTDTKTKNDLDSISLTSEIEDDIASVTLHEIKQIELDKIADDLVTSVLDAVKLELTTRYTLKTTTTNEGFLKPFKADESPLQSCSVYCPYHSPRSFTSAHSSPHKASQHINKALHLLESELGHSYDPDIKTSSEKDDNPLLKESVSPMKLETTNYSSRSKIDSLPLPIFSKGSPSGKVEPNTADYLEEDLSDENLIEIQTSTTSSPSSSESQLEIERSRSRLRTNSFSTDNPSFLLLSARNTHTIQSEDRDQGRNDVKRRLDMNSDSEESLLSGAITDFSLKSINFEAKATIPEYCRLLEEQHKKELHNLQQLHQLQLEKYREKLLVESPIPSEETSLFFEDDHPFHHQVNIDPEVHFKWCKLSALIKGHLTRKLLTSLPVQSTMKTIRDTSRTILSMRNEDTSSSTNMSAIQDATLMQRLFSQLKAAMFEFHSYFFEYTIEEQMDIIARTRISEAKINRVKNIESPTVARLSAATLKSLQRKRDVRRSQEDNSIDVQRKSIQSDRKRVGTKEVKSKISSIWKVGPSKKSTKLGFKSNRKSPSKQRNSYCEIQSPLAVSNRKTTRQRVTKR